MMAFFLTLTSRRFDVKVALVGFGTVGQSVARILCDKPREGLSLSLICNRRVERKIVDWVPGHVVWTSTFEDVLRSDADVVIEVIGGSDPAVDWIRRSLKCGKSVVTANKQVIARDGISLMHYAREQKRHLLFEAAVAGGIPIIRGVQTGLSGDRLTKLFGLLNGTCNYILTRMESGQLSFNEALQEAQDLGYAESDPSADVDGYDAQAKLAILSAVGLECPVEVAAIPVHSIRPVESVDFNYAQRLGCSIRQVSRAELLETDPHRVRASVQPMLVAKNSVLGRTVGSQNVVVVTGARGGETAFSGFGAGGDPTAVAVVSDLVALARGGEVSVAWPTGGDTQDIEIEFMASHYVRFVVVDRPGIIAELAEVFARHDVNFDSVLQEPGWSKSELPFVVTLERCSSRAVREAILEIAALDFHARQAVWMPILTSGKS